jgi:hypothetical protein
VHPADPLGSLTPAEVPLIEAEKLSEQAGPPQTLRLLEDTVVELNIVDRASDSTIGRTLKKTFSSPIANSNGSSRRRPTARS